MYITVQTASIALHVFFTQFLYMDELNRCLSLNKHATICLRNQVSIGRRQKYTSQMPAVCWSWSLWQQTCLTYNRQSHKSIPKGPASSESMIHECFLTGFVHHTVKSYDTWLKGKCFKCAICQAMQVFT